MKFANSFRRYSVWQYCEAVITISLAGFIVATLTNAPSLSA